MSPVLEQVMASVNIATTSTSPVLAHNMEPDMSSVSGLAVDLEHVDMYTVYPALGKVMETVSIPTVTPVLVQSMDSEIIPTVSPVLGQAMESESIPTMSHVPGQSMESLSITTVSPPVLGQDMYMDAAGMQDGFDWDGSVAGFSGNSGKVRAQFIVPYSKPPRGRCKDWQNCENCSRNSDCGFCKNCLDKSLRYVYLLHNSCFFEYL